jgi:LacI family transcriptional regulator
MKSAAGTGMERTTLMTVACEAGLGRSTVGLILNGRGDALGIPQKTQRKVFQVARQLGYRPNSLALGLAGKHTQTIGLLLPSGPFFPQYLMPQDLSLRLHRRGFQTNLVDSLQEEEVILESLAEMATRRVNGIVFTIFHNDQLTPSIHRKLIQFPVTVLITNEPLPRDDLRAHIIHQNMTPAITDIVDHFVRIGRRRPMIATSVGPSNEEKIRAFKNAMRRHGLDASDEAAVFDIGGDRSHGPDFYTRFLVKFESEKLEDRAFDALFCTCDEGATAAVNYLAKRGLRVPQDVSIVGMNNAPWVQGMRPPLASLSWGYPGSFDNIESRLVERLEQPASEPGYDDVPLKFIWRESAG